MDVKTINALGAPEAAAEFSTCCGSSQWSSRMTASRPFSSMEGLQTTAADIWCHLSEADWLEAFKQHPKIGDIDSLRSKFAHTKELARGEQSGVNGASTDVLLALKQGNDDYEKKFGYIFIVCASGKTAPEMLSLLNARLKNDQESEIKIAMQEQAKITQLRLEKLLS